MAGSVLPQGRFAGTSESILTVSASSWDLVLSFLKGLRLISFAVLGGIRFYRSLVELFSGLIYVKFCASFASIIGTKLTKLELRSKYFYRETWFGNGFACSLATDQRT